MTVRDETYNNTVIVVGYDNRYLEECRIMLDNGIKNVCEK